MECARCKRIRTIFGRKMCASCLTSDIRSKWVMDIRELADEVKITLGCTDCGYRDNPIAMDFDHISDKKYSISQMVRGRSGKITWDEMLDEMSKCEIRCANCHRIKTQLERLQK